MNRTPHIVGGGLGTFRKAGQKAREESQRAAAEEQRKAAMHRVAAVMKSR